MEIIVVHGSFTNSRKKVIADVETIGDVIKLMPEVFGNDSWKDNYLISIKYNEVYKKMEETNAIVNETVFYENVGISENNSTPILKSATFDNGDRMDINKIFVFFSQSKGSGGMTEEEITIWKEINDKLSKPVSKSISTSTQIYKSENNQSNSKQNFEKIVNEVDDEDEDLLNY